ncbi:CYFA0S35e00210g1_1 [Cyberlindnera fabianii]|uniref:CYFA0S35e00210g1_1 n=1 Tax=Cyberlindnera fabianii TaxID=36022 RepID=A0A061BE43_CYBFA|nr:CYFA0S35e00210g1_1 [Cyberlindnera fabianii]
MEKLDRGTKVVVGSHEAEMEEYIAEGGFAHIYRVKYSPVVDGKDEAALKRVIVKTKPELNLLRKEVDTMKRLAHSKYVVTYYDSNAQKLEDGTYEVLLLMEFCPNKSLLDYMNMHLKTKLNVDQITKIMYEITQAVADMHAQKLIHRDLKIENVLINADGDFKLADFGSTSTYIAAPSNQEEFQLVAHDIIHNTTPQYRAPEMIDLYRGLAIDDKSDIWALGVFLFKLMYYTTPFETQGELAILHGVFQFPPHPRYTSRLKNLVIIMLQVNPMLRPNVYQVLYEICDIMKTPVPIKDTYGLGKYDFEAYERYQQQIMMQQEQQRHLQEQYLLQKQQEQALLAQQQQQQQQQQKQQQQQQQQQHQVPQPVPSLAPAQDIKSSSPSPQPQGSDDGTYPLGKSTTSQSIHPQELTKSSKSSVGDLKSLGDELNRNDDEFDDDLNNVENRFPDLDEIEAAAQQKYPEIEQVNSGSVGSPRVDQAKMSIDRSRDVSRTPSVKTSVEEREDEVPNKGLKFTKTEAWTVPAAPDNDVNGIEIDGVFHKADGVISETADETNVTQESLDDTSPHQVVKVQNSFDNLFDFDSNSTSLPQMGNSPYTQSGSRTASQGMVYSSISQPNSRSATYYTPQVDGQSQQQQQQHHQQQQMASSRNPFPTSSRGPMTKNPFPTTTPGASNASLEVKKTLIPERSGGNPWAQYTQQDGYKIAQQPVTSPNHQPLQPRLASQNNTISSSAAAAVPSQQKPQQQHVTQEQAPAKPPRPTKQVTTPNIAPQSNKIISPTITLSSHEDKLVDIDDSTSEHRPKLDLHMRTVSLDKSGPSDSSTMRTVNKEDSTDSDGESTGDDLKVEVMKVRTTSTHSRTSSEMNRLNLDLQELDLDGDFDDDDDDDDDDETENENGRSRRSINLRRSSSGQRRSGRKSEEKRRSFLGF